MPNVSGVPTGAEVQEIVTECDSCRNQVVAMPEKGVIEQVVGGRIVYGSISRINEVVLMFDCLNCDYQNDVIA